MAANCHTLHKPDMIEKTRAMMERQVNHLVHLVDDLLDVARISAGRLSPTLS